MRQRPPQPHRREGVHTQHLRAKASGEGAALMEEGCKNWCLTLDHINGLKIFI